MKEYPYGKWTCKDGRVIYFNRRYVPMFEEHEGVWREADSSEWVEGVIDETWFYDDSTSPSRNQETLKQVQAIYERCLKGVQDSKIRNE